GPVLSYNAINVNGSGTNDDVDFIDSGSNTSLSGFNITLTNSPKAEAVQIRQTTFVINAGLTINTTTGIQLLSASLTTKTGPIPMQANVGGTYAGDLIGIDIQGATIFTSGGAVTLNGHGGTDTDNAGVRLTSGAKVQSEFFAPITITGTSTSASGQFSDGV